MDRICLNFDRRLYENIGKVKSSLLQPQQPQPQSISNGPYAGARSGDSSTRIWQIDLVAPLLERIRDGKTLFLKDIAPIFAVCQVNPTLELHDWDANMLLDTLNQVNNDASPSIWEELGYVMTNKYLDISSRCQSATLRAEFDVISWCEKILDCFAEKEFYAAVSNILLFHGITQALTAHYVRFTLENIMRIFSMARLVCNTDFAFKVDGVLITPPSVNEDNKLDRCVSILLDYESMLQPVGVSMIQSDMVALLENSIYNSKINSSLYSTNAISPWCCIQFSTFTSVFSEIGLDLNKLGDFASKVLRYLEGQGDALLTAESYKQDQLSKLKGSALRLLTLAYVLTRGKINPSNVVELLIELLNNYSQMSIYPLNIATVDSVALISTNMPSESIRLSKWLRAFSVQSHSFTSQSAGAPVTGARLAWCLKARSEDALISTYYSLINVLTAGNKVQERYILRQNETLVQPERLTSSSMISLGSQPDDRKYQIYLNVIRTIVELTVELKEFKMAELAISLFSQKLYRHGQVVDNAILQGLSRIAPVSDDKDFSRILKIQSNFILRHHNDPLLIYDAKFVLANHNSLSILRIESCVTDLAHLIIGLHIRNSEHTHIASHILKLCEPLGILAKQLLIRLGSLTNNISLNAETSSALRGLWFHFGQYVLLLDPTVIRTYSDFLESIAKITPPIVLENSTNELESNLELVPEFRSSHHLQSELLRASLSKKLFENSAPLKTLSLSKISYLSAIYLLETLRSRAGCCTKILSYYAEETVVESDILPFLNSISDVVALQFVEAMKFSTSSWPVIETGSNELRQCMIFCFHPSSIVRKKAFYICDLIISNMPDLLTLKNTVYALLELLQLSWLSCVDAQINQYTPCYHFTSILINCTIELPDTIEDRDQLFSQAQAHAKKWLSFVLDGHYTDLTVILEAYLLEDSLEEKYNVHQGRSMANDILGTMPATDYHGNSLYLPTSWATRKTSNIGPLSLPLTESIVDSLPQLTHVLIDRLQQLVFEIQQQGQLSSQLRNVEQLLSECRLVLVKPVPLDLGLELIQVVAQIPFLDIGSSSTTRKAITLWNHISSSSPHLHAVLINEVTRHWIIAAHGRKGIFDYEKIIKNPFLIPMAYEPSNKYIRAQREREAYESFSPFVQVLKFLLCNFEYCSHQSIHLARSIFLILQSSIYKSDVLSLHSMSRHARFMLILFGLKFLQRFDLLEFERYVQYKNLLKMALQWFTPKHTTWTFGHDQTSVIADQKVLVQILHNMSGSPNTLLGLSQLLTGLLENELSRLETWLKPTSRSSATATICMVQLSTIHLKIAWKLEPALAINLAGRSIIPRASEIVRQLIIREPWRCVRCAAAAEIALGGEFSKDVWPLLTHLFLWKPVSPITALTYFLPEFDKNLTIAQYAMRSLESHSVDTTFFYIPQIVQALRYDAQNYVERFILQAAQISQLFAHQIIWNMDANAYKDEDSREPDSLKPALDEVKENIANNLRGDNKTFYEREFAFFSAVTSISGKLKPYIKRPKSEKKAMIDAEMAKLKLDVGVYLPSNPDGEIVGIDRKSGKPLQSHAKAPFMATFRTRGKATGEMDIWQSAIFKVGDDCRQDVLALQLIAAFRNIFESIGLDLYVYPYRVTATAPGCGVIEVLPGFSRDMLGRETVNGLYEFFVNTHGSPNTVPYQKARNNFVQSMAAYSIISYLLQFKDRHNGNIMYDNEGHILHIDFGFCFDISPGGITFESAPFKLTHEMVAVMGGQRNTQAFKWYEELCVKGYLASRLYQDDIIHCVRLMLDSGLPCFKGQKTITNLRNRFCPGKTDQEASNHMMSLIDDSYQNRRTRLYDKYQKVTNGKQGVVVRNLHMLTF